MANMIIVFGIVCLAAAIVGGGLKALGIEMPVIQSHKRQVILALFGLVLLLAAVVEKAHLVERFVASNTQISSQAAPAPQVQTAKPTAPTAAPARQKPVPPSVIPSTRDSQPNERSARVSQNHSTESQTKPMQTSTATLAPSPVKTPQQVRAEAEAAELNDKLMKYAKEYYAMHPGADPKEVLGYVRDKLDMENIHVRFWIGDEQVKFPCRLKSYFRVSGTNNHIDRLTVNGCASDSAIEIKGEGNTLAHATVNVGDDEEQDTSPKAPSSAADCPPNTAICQIGQGSKTSDSRFFGGRWNHLIYTNGVNNEVTNTLYAQEMDDAVSSPANLQSALDTIKERQRLSWASLSMADRSEKEQQAESIESQIKATNIHDRTALKDLLNKLIALI